MTRSPFQRVLAALEAHERRPRQHGDQIDALCPAHDDQSPSLSARYDRAAGKVLINCHTGCAGDDVIAALGLIWSDLFDPKLDEEDRVRKPQIVATYDYTDEHGEVLFQKVRYAPKDFRVRRPDGRAGWEWRIGDARRVLYRLHEVAAAIAAGKPVLLVEGEKDADRVVDALGIAATCNYEGAAKEGQRPKWRREYTEQLRGAKVLIVADNDAAGYAHARAAAASLQGVAEQVRIVRPAVDDPKADISDHLDAGLGIERLLPVADHPDEQAADDNPEAGQQDEAAISSPDGQPSSGLSRFLLPDEVWAYSPLLQQIRTAAFSRLVSPDAVLHAVFSVVASLLHHETRVETGKGPSTLSYYFSPVGDSGAGKSEALKAARELLAKWSGERFAITAADGYVDAPLGSGEGLIEAFMGDVKREMIDPATGAPILNKDGNPRVETVRAQIAHNALFHTDEGRQVLAIDARKGATTLAVLCELWSGSVAGQTNADRSRTRKLAAGTYVVGMMIGFQTSTIDALFADEAGGAPQRFAFAPAEYAPYADNLDEDIDVEWPGDLIPAIGVDPITVQLADEQRREVRRAIRIKAAGRSTDSPLDGHRMLLRCRVAALVALLHGEQVGSEQTWELSRVLVAHSCALRDHLAELGKRRAEEAMRRQRGRATADAVEAQIRADTNRRVVAAAGRLARAIDKKGANTTGRALNALGSDVRDIAQDALDHAVRTGMVRLSDDGKRVLPVGEEVS